MNKLLLLIAVLCLKLTAAKAQTDSFIVDGVYRNYIIHLPAGYSASVSHPLVLSLHGYTSNATEEELYTSMDGSADANNYIVVYPNGIANYWNSFGTGADDVKFLSQLIDTMSAHYSVNTRRVYSCGISNGGYMSYTLACMLSDKIAAIASVSGTMSLNTYANCNPVHKVPVMHIHGTADAVVPYATGAANSIGVEQTLAFWRDTDNCTAQIDTTNLPNTNIGDSCTVQKIDNITCNQSEVLFYKIFNGGHTWPGGALNIPAYGNTDRDISATTEIWNFFNRYTLDGPTGINEPEAQQKISGYPNPSSGMLYIKTDAVVERSDIYDLSGRKIMSFASGKVLDISSLEPGVYLMTIIIGDEQTILKFAKQ